MRSWWWWWWWWWSDQHHQHDHDFHGCTSEGKSGCTSEWKSGCTSEWSSWWRWLLLLLGFWFWWLLCLLPWLFYSCSSYYYCCSCSCRCPSMSGKNKRRLRRNATARYALRSLSLKQQTAVGQSRQLRPQHQWPDVWDHLCRTAIHWEQRTISNCHKCHQYMHKY